MVDGGFVARSYSGSGGGGTCLVSWDGGASVSVLLRATSCTPAGVGFNEPVAIATDVPCDVSALPEGTYAVDGTSDSVTLPLSASAVCP